MGGECAVNLASPAIMGLLDNFFLHFVFYFFPLVVMPLYFSIVLCFVSLFLAILACFLCRTYSLFTFPVSLLGPSILLDCHYPHLSRYFKFPVFG